MRRTIAVIALVAVGLVSGCTASTAPPAPTVRNSTVTQTRSVTDSASPVPVGSGSATEHAAPTCPFLRTDQQATADVVGMRLARTATLVQGGRVVGCNIYALQHSPLHNSEHLPGPKQPAIQIVRTTYSSAHDAHNALALTASAPGTSNAQQEDVTGADGPAICYQSTFDPTDRKKEWSCAFQHGTHLFVVRTVVESPAFTVVQLCNRIVDR